MKRGVNPAYNARNGPVTTRLARPEELKFKRQLRGRGWVKPKRQIGDIATVFGIEYVAFKGGEGGRNWSITATEWK